MFQAPNGSPDQSWVLSGSEDCSVRLWDVEKKQCLRVFEGHDSPVYCAKWSPDQSRVLSSSDDGSVRLWDVETGQCLRIFEGHLYHGEVSTGKLHRRLETLLEY